MSHRHPPQTATPLGETTDSVAAKNTRDASGRPHLLADNRREFERARLALDMGKARTALTLLEGCLRIEPDHPEYLGLYGVALCRSGGDLHQARRACERAVADRPEDPILHTQLGIVLEAARQPEAARQAYEQALHLDPQQTQAQLGLETVQRRPSRFRLRSLLRLLRR